MSSYRSANCGKLGSSNMKGLLPLFGWALEGLRPQDAARRGSAGMGVGAGLGLCCLPRLIGISDPLPKLGLRSHKTRPGATPRKRSPNPKRPQARFMGTPMTSQRRKATIGLARSDAKKGDAERLNGRGLSPLHRTFRAGHIRRSSPHRRRKNAPAQSRVLSRTSAARPLARLRDGQLWLLDRWVIGWRNS